MQSRVDYIIYRSWHRGKFNCPDLVRRPAGFFRLCRGLNLFNSLELMGLDLCCIGGFSSA